IVQIPVGIVQNGHQGVGLVGQLGGLSLELGGGIARDVFPSGGKCNEQGGQPDQYDDEQAARDKDIQAAELEGNLFLKGALVKDHQAVLMQQLAFYFLALLFVFCHTDKDKQGI